MPSRAKGMTYTAFLIIKSRIFNATFASRDKNHYNVYLANAVFI